MSQLILTESGSILLAENGDRLAISVSVGEPQFYTQDDSKYTLAPILGGLPRWKPAPLGAIPKRPEQIDEEENEEEEDELAFIMALLNL